MECPAVVGELDLVGRGVLEGRDTGPHAADQLAFPEGYAHGAHPFGEELDALQQRGRRGSSSHLSCGVQRVILGGVARYPVVGAAAPVAAASVAPDRVHKSGVTPSPARSFNQSRQAMTFPGGATRTGSGPSRT